jgi:hypothetical protein
VPVPQAVAATLPGTVPRGADPSAAVSAARTADGCTARIATTARHVEVTWNGQRLGTTPLDGVAVPCGAAEVVLVHPGYQRAVRRVEARPGETAAMTVELERPMGLLTLRSRPAGATFTVDGVPVGIADQQVRVRGYSHVQVTATLAGRRRWSKRIYVRGTSMSVVADLTPLARSRCVSDSR